MFFTHLFSTLFCSCVYESLECVANVLGGRPCCCCFWEGNLLLVTKATGTAAAPATGTEAAAAVVSPVEASPSLEQ